VKEKIKIIDITVNAAKLDSFMLGLTTTEKVLIQSKSKLIFEYPLKPKTPASISIKNEPATAGVNGAAASSKHKTDISTDNIKKSFFTFCPFFCRAAEEIK